MNVILAGGAVVAMGAVVRWMLLANRRDERHIARRRQEWIDGGRVPEEEPRFAPRDFGGGGGA